MTATKDGGSYSQLSVQFGVAQQGQKTPNAELLTEELKEEDR